MFQEYHRIKASLNQRNTVEALQWCSENRSHLKKTCSPLEFILRRQDILDMISQDKKGPAILYAKKHLLTMASDATLLPGIQQALAMLIVPTKTQHLPYQDLSDEGDRWEEITCVFTEAHHSLYGLSRQPPLLQMMQMGCAAFKTPACGGKDGRVLDCPACCEELNSLVRTLPFAHYEYSRLYCRMSKELIREDDPPYVLPNGQIYSSLV